MSPWLLLLACDPSTAPTPPPAAVLCSRVYGSTVDSLEELHASADGPAPSFVPKSTWLERCVSLGFSDEQLRCADPKMRMADPACEAVLDPVRDRLQRLQEELLQPKESP